MENGDGNENPLQKPLKSPRNGIDDGDHQPLEGTPISPSSSSSSGLPSAHVSSSSSSSSSSCFEDQSINPEQSRHSPSHAESLSCQDISTQTTQWSMMSCSPSNSPRVSSSPENQSHQTQPAGYDPSRIPLTIFDSKSNAAVDWSVASTESLFSVHMGNNSFSRDHALLQMNNKSGDLTKFSEDGTAVFSSEATKHNNERKSFSSALPTVMEGALDNEEKSEQTSEALQVQQGPSVIKGPKPANQKLKSQDNGKIASSSEIHSFDITSNKSDERGGATPCLNAPRLSNERGAGSSSFAFPLLVNDGGNASSLKSVPEEKAEPEHQSGPGQADPGSSKEVSRPVENNWFSYLFCLRRCSS